MINQKVTNYQNMQALLQESVRRIQETHGGRLGRIGEEEEAHIRIIKQKTLLENMFQDYLMETRAIEVSSAYESKIREADMRESPLFHALQNQKLTRALRREDQQMGLQKQIYRIAGELQRKRLLQEVREKKQVKHEKVVRKEHEKALIEHVYDNRIGFVKALIGQER